ncbi:hypothetical protein F4818DRAFT_46543 [Hypoxylon cercidicola]|nr:hypothetical protein F4818DRAFT_46543 [Hypoxylon cercidicola]
MYRSRIAWPALVTSLASLVSGQYSGWLENQVNTTLCKWSNFRVATLKDAVYMDGGRLYWLPGMADGSFLPPIDDGNRLSLVGILNFSTPFNTSTNASTLLTTISKAPNGGAASNFAPNYYGGALLANDAEFYLYGGAMLGLTGDSPPDGDELLGYRASQYGDDAQPFQQGFLNAKLPGGVTRYVTYGGGVNAPSENKAWYFGGLRTQSWGQIYDHLDNATYIPSNISNSFVELDMTTQQQEVWTNKTLPPGTPSRAGPSVVWVPVGEQGILVVLGGVTYPSFINASGTGSANPTQNARDSPGFMTNIDIYDIAGNKWYQQETVGAPSQYALGCAVVATAQDYSSFNIYYYGGYDAISENSEMNDDVWILSLPSFMWMKVTSAVPGHGRAGHQCVMPYPDQMITIGGYPSGGGSQCLEGDPPEFLQVYNLTAGHWMDSYDPESWNEYGVPEMIHMMIGGDYSGSATITTPTPSGWATPDLASVFATPYPTTKLTTYYPYSTVGAGNGTRGELNSDGGGGTPSWVGPVLGVVLGLIFITAIVVAVLLYRRRKLLKKNAGSEPSTDENGNRIRTWIQTQQNDGKTVTSDDSPTNLDDMESRGMTPVRSPLSQPEIGQYPSELPYTPLVELMGDKPPMSELPAHNYDMNNSPFASVPHTPHSTSTPTNQSFFSYAASQDHAGSIHSTNGPATSSLSQINERPDSPSLGNGSDHHFNNIASITNPTFDADSPAPNYDAGHVQQAGDPQVSPPLPVSPPSVIADGPGEATDYISVHRQGSSGTSTGSPLRRSVFRESENDLGEENQPR